jgi:PIN domain nuclease of toxin-antitoxin system
MDASAILAAFEREPEWEKVSSLFKGAIISAVNWAEVHQKALERGATQHKTSVWAASVGLDVAQFTSADAEQTAALWPQTRHLGLSLGDRACLSLARKLGLRAVTADRRWAGLDVGVDIQFIR